MNLQRFPIRILALAIGMIILNCWSQSHFSNLPLLAFDVGSSVSLASTKLTDIKITSKSTQKLDSWQGFSLLENSTPIADMNNHVFLPYLVNTIKRSYNNPSYSLDSQHTDLVMGLSFEYDSSNWVPTLLADNGIESSEGVSIRAIGLANEAEGAWLILAAFRNKSELDVNTWIEKYDYSRSGVPPTYRMHTLRGFSAVTINEALQVYQGTPPNRRTIVNTGTMVYLIEYASMKPNFLEFELFLKKIQFFLPASQFSESSLSLTLAESYEKAGKTLYSSPASASSMQSTSVETCCGVTDPEYNPFPCPADGSHGNCTWWVRYRRTGDNRANLALCTGNADTWDFCASQHYPDLLVSSPSANAVAAWTTINHVQFIERINSNGSYHISEMNWPTDTSPGTCQREFDQTKTSNIQFIRHPDGGSSCSAPTLNNPGDGQTLSSRTVTFSWQTINGCGNGYTFRIKDTGDMDSGGTTIVDTGEGGTSRTETIPSQYENRDLYWGVRAANATNASWAVRRFRIQPPPTPPTYTPVPAGQAKLYNQANFGGSVVWSGNAGFNNEPNANSYSLQLPSGWSAKTWRGDNRSGEERCWSGSINNLQDHGWQNAIQSIEIFTSNACPTVTPTFTPTNTPRSPTPTATPIPQSCTNPPPDRNVAYLFENENCVNPWNWSSGHPSDGANRNAKSAWMPNGKVLLLSERNDGGEPRICLSSPVRNLADIGWGNRVEWAEMRYGCPVVQPTATPAGPKHEAKFYEEPNFANQVFTLNSPGTYRYSDLGYVDQFRKFYSVDLCSGCSIQLTNKRGDSICWGWDENNIGDHGDWPLVTVQIKFSYQNECPPREPSLQSPEEGAQFWEGDSVYVVWKDNDDPTSMYFTTEVRYGGTTIAQKYRTTDRSLTLTNLAPGSYTIQSQSCSDLMCSSWKTRSFSVRVNPTATPTWTPTATDTATTRPTTTPTFTATPSPQPITTATATVTFPSRSAIPSVISPQSELVVGIGEAVTFRWQPLSYPVEYLIYVNRNGVRIADSGGLRSNTWTYTFTEPGTYEWTISSLCLGCTEYFSGFSQTYRVYAGGAPTATPTDVPLPSPTSTATPTREPDCSISIEQGALFTGQPTVRIHVAVPNAAEVQLSNDGGFTGAFWQPYANELTWTLSDPGQKIVTLLVYARFRDAASRPLCSNTALPDDIIYDPLPPTVRIESFTPPTYVNAATQSAGTPGLLTIVAEDQAGGSGVTSMRVGYQADLSTLPWIPFTAVTQVAELTGKTIFVEVRDAVGNRSTTASWSVNSASSLYLPLIKR